MLRRLIAKLNKSLAERVTSVRHKCEVPIKISFEPTGATGKLDMSPKTLYVMGETADLSQTGIAFIVPTIRVKENYLVGEGRILNVELDLPNGKVSMKVVGQRYELIGEHISVARYLVGASIAEMSNDNREAYQEFLRLGGRKGNTGSLKFGVRESL